MARETPCCPKCMKPMTRAMIENSKRSGTLNERLVGIWLCDKDMGGCGGCGEQVPYVPPRR